MSDSDKRQRDRQGEAGTEGELANYITAPSGKRVPVFQALLRTLAWAITAMSISSSSSADCVLNIFANPMPPFSTFTVLFPNWTRAPTASFMLEECDDVVCSWCASSSLSGLTIVNYGTASGGAAGDITGMYFNYVCGTKGVTAIVTMTFAGNWDVGGPVLPAWTWAGNLALPNDPCGTDCYCWPNLNVWACRIVGGIQVTQAVSRDVIRIETTGLSSPRRRASTCS